jgi:hypothetical protein
MNKKTPMNRSRENKNLLLVRQFLVEKAKDHKEMLPTSKCPLQVLATSAPRLKPYSAQVAKLSDKLQIVFTNIDLFCSHQNKRLLASTPIKKEPLSIFIASGF